MAMARVMEEEIRSDEMPALHVVHVDPRDSKDYRRGVPVYVRRAARARMVRRRRRTIAIGVLAVVTVLLALPGHAFGGESNVGVPVDQSNGAQLAPGMVYVVQGNDTLASIAARVNPNSPSVAKTALKKELGSSVVVPGEHILIP